MRKWGNGDIGRSSAAGRGRDTRRAGRPSPQWGDGCWPAVDATTFAVRNPIVSRGPLRAASPLPSAIFPSSFALRRIFGSRQRGETRNGFANTKMQHDSRPRQSAKSDVRSVCQRCAVANGARLRIRENEDSTAKRVAGTLPPRCGTGDEVTVRADGDRVGKLAAGGQVARNVTIIGSVIRQIRLAILRIEHNDLLAQFVANQIKRSNETFRSSHFHSGWFFNNPK